MPPGAQAASAARIAAVSSVLPSPLARYGGAVTSIHCTVPSAAAGSPAPTTTAAPVVAAAAAPSSSLRRSLRNRQPLAGICASRTRVIPPGKFVVETCL